VLTFKEAEARAQEAYAIWRGADKTNAGLPAWQDLEPWQRGAFTWLTLHENKRTSDGYESKAPAIIG
jgi:hypothetical protein